MDCSEVYEKLYDIVEKNMEAAGGQLEYTKTTLLCDVGSAPHVIDVSRFLKLDNKAFIQAVHVAALKRLPDEATVSFWQQRYDEPREQFQEEVLRSIAHSSVVAINQLDIINNPYFEQKKDIRYRLLGHLYGLTDKSSLREFGKKLPQPIQKIIRKIFI